MTRLAVLGTGIMGGAMARRWATHGFDVVAWNRDRSKAEALTDALVTVADDPSAAVDGADVIVTMLADGDVTEKVMVDALGAAAPTAIWLQMATVGIDATERLQAMAAGVGMAYVDAPVSGTKQPAEQGTLTVLAGGPAELHERCEPIFAPVAANVVWVGDVGAGSRLKLVITRGWPRSWLGSRRPSRSPSASTWILASSLRPSTAARSARGTRRRRVR